MYSQDARKNGSYSQLEKSFETQNTGELGTIDLLESRNQNKEVKESKTETNTSNSTGQIVLLAPTQRQNQNLFHISKIKMVSNTIVKSKTYRKITNIRNSELLNFDCKDFKIRNTNESGQIETIPNSVYHSHNDFSIRNSHNDLK